MTFVVYGLTLKNGEGSENAPLMIAGLIRQISISLRQFGITMGEGDSPYQTMLRTYAVATTEHPSN